MTDRILFIAIFIIISSSFFYRRYAIGRRDAYLLRAGLLCTLSADFCMLIIYNNVIGLMFFICAQTIYFFRYMSARLYAVVLIPVLFAAYTALTWFTPLTLESRLAGVYACALITSTVTAFLRRGSYPRPNRTLIPLGMLLFMLCDINVGLMNVLPDSPGKAAAHALIWVFYLPSQILLSVSGRNIEINRNFIRRENL